MIKESFIALGDMYEFNSKWLKKLFIDYWLCLKKLVLGFGDTYEFNSINSKWLKKLFGEMNMEYWLCLKKLVLGFDGWF
jgi:hypothetical protein